MKKPSCIIILFVLLGFGVSLFVPAEDVPETAYDESEATPYEGTPLFSIAASQASSRITKADSSGSRLHLNTSSRGCNRSRDKKAQSDDIPGLLIILGHSLRC